MAAAQATQNAITLKGSIDIVTEFFGALLAQCSILYSSLASWLTPGFNFHVYSIEQDMR